MAEDWDYSMIAFHYASRSYSYEPGSDQVKETQEGQLDRQYDDIAYHFGVDCCGSIYEGRDVRLKGSSLRGDNTGVISIVFLNNLTTAPEGIDIWSMGRESLEYLGINTSDVIPPRQLAAAFDLVTVLKEFFVITRLGEHREFPGQATDGTIFPGNSGMEFVKRMRAVKGLFPPPSSL